MQYPSIDTQFSSSSSSSTLWPAEFIAPTPMTASSPSTLSSSMQVDLTEACNKQKRLIPLLIKFVDETLGSLTLQQVLLEEMLKLEDWPDADFRRCALSLILQADEEGDLPLVGFRTLNPFPICDERFGKYNLIFLFASERNLLKVPLGTILASDRSSLEWQQGTLSPDALTRVGHLYYNLFTSISADYSLTFQKLKKLIRPGIKKQSLRTQKNLLKETQTIYKKTQQIALQTEKTLPPEQLYPHLQQNARVVQRCMNQLKNKMAALDLSDRTRQSHIISLISSLNMTLKIARVFYKVAKNCSIPVSLTGTYFKTLSFKFSLKEEDVGQETIAAFIEGLSNNESLKGNGISPTTSWKDWSHVWLHRTFSFKEALEHLPLDYNKETFLKGYDQIYRSMLNQRLGNANRKLKQRQQRIDDKATRLESGMTISEAEFELKMILENLWREASHKNRFFKGAIGALQRHLESFSLTMPSENKYELPEWILELERTAPPREKRREKSAVASSSHALESSSSEEEGEDLITTHEIERSLPPPQPIQELFSEISQWDQPINIEDSFQRLKSLPRLSLIFENKLKPKSKMPLEATLLKEARHHLFLLHQGMQILLTAAIHGDKAGLTMALPNLVLDHHSFLEAHLKSQLAMAKNELATHHSLTKLGRDLQQPDEVQRYLDDFAQGALWERYLYTSKALHVLDGKPSPEAVELMAAALDGSIEPEKIVDFAMRSYRQLLVYLAQNTLIDDEANINENIDTLVAKVTTWMKLVTHTATNSANRTRKGKGKGKSKRKIHAPVNPILSEATRQHVQALFEAIVSVDQQTYNEDNPAIPAKEVCAHLIRLDWALHSASVYKSPELAAFHWRNLYTVTYLFEQCYRARAVAQGLDQPLLGHGFVQRQKVLDPDKGLLNSKTNQFFVGIARRYPEYFKFKPLLELLKSSRQYLDIENGFTLAGPRGRFIQYHSEELISKMGECREIAATHLELLARDLKQHKIDLEEQRRLLSS